MKDYIRDMFNIGEDSRIRKIFDIVATFCVVAYGWMLFYAPDMNFIVNVTKGYFNWGVPYIHQTTIFFFGIGFTILFIKDFIDEYFSDKIVGIEERYPRMTLIMNYIKFAILAVLIIWIGVLGGGQFIYFKF